MPKDPGLILSSFKAILDTKLRDLEAGRREVQARDRGLQTPCSNAVIKELTLLRNDLERLTRDDEKK